MQGLSGENELRKAWNKLSDNSEDLDVQWELKNISKKFTVFNIKKFLTGSDNIGHWVLLYKNPEVLYYYDPFGIIAPFKLCDRLNVDAIACNVGPEQKGGVDCGFFCLTQAWNIENNLKSTRDLILVTKNIILDPFQVMNENIIKQHEKMLPLYYQQ